MPIKVIQHPIHESKCDRCLQTWQFTSNPEVKPAPPTLLELNHSDRFWELCPDCVWQLLLFLKNDPGRRSRGPDGVITPISGSETFHFKEGEVAPNPFEVL